MMRVYVMQKALTNLSKEEKRSYWKAWVASWLKSGEDKKRFCRRHELNYDLFMYYSRRYAHKKNQATFVPVKLVSSLSSYEIVFPSGVVLKFSATVPLPDFIRSVAEWL